jgi:RHS repeat-associated protein
MCTLRSDVNGDGFVNQSHHTGIIRPRNGATIGTAAYAVEADLDRDGVINQVDYDISIADDGKSSSGGVGEAGLFSRGVRNSVGYCGYIFNEDSGLYTVRFRTYSPTLDRWLERDPAGYVDGMGLYEYVRGGPIAAVDPTGLDGVDIKFKHWMRARGMPGWDWVPPAPKPQGFSLPYSVWHYLKPSWFGTFRTGNADPIYVSPDGMKVLIIDYSKKHLAELEGHANDETVSALKWRAAGRCLGERAGTSIGMSSDEVLKDGGSGNIDDPARINASPLLRWLGGREDAWAAVLNEWTYNAAFKCRVSAIVTCCGDGRVRVRGVLRCTMQYQLIDKFDNPGDIGGPHATGYNFGDWYLFFGSFKHEFTRRIDSGPADCGCTDRAEDPYAEH